ncbi:hypothetical protein GCM10027347_55380 [Larkinella harenae]
MEHQLVQESQLLNGKFRLKIVAYTVAGIKQYGALLIPKTNSPLPVRMLIGGFGLGITENSVTLTVDSSLINSPFILAIPALRGQSLAITVNGTRYTSPVSEGDHCDAFDGATDDTLAFLNLIQQIESQADVSRTSVRGGSRGGTVALLAGIRDKRIKRVVGVVSPTDFVGLTAQHENDPTYQCQFLKAIPHTPASLQEARTKLIASSPLYFADQLPLTQLHMGLNDWNVPIAQGTELEQKMIALGKSSTFSLYTYPKTHSDIAINNPELISRIEQFLAQL